MKIKKSWKHGEVIEYLIIFLLLCIFFYLVPYTDDDLRWGSQLGMKRLANGFKGYGGRYLGYVLVIGLTRSTIFKALFMSAIVTLLAYLVRYITKLQTATYVVMLSIMLAPVSLFSSTIAWVSGFANYVTSVCFTLAYISYVIHFERKNVKKHSIGVAVLLCMLGLINTLLVEHFTIYNVCLAIFVIILSIIKYKCIFTQFIGYAIGAFAGAVWMFSNSAYSKVLNGKDSYRDVGSNGLLKSIGYGLKRICQYGYFDNLILNAAIFLALCLVVSRYKKVLNKSKQRMVKICLLVDFGYIIASFLIEKVFQGTDSVDKGVYFVIISISLLSVLARMIVALLFAKDYACFKYILFLLVSIVIANAPFLVVKPITPRVFFETYIFFTVILCILLEQLCQEIELLSKEKVDRLCKIGLIVGASFYFVIFSTIYKADRERLQDIQRQVEAGSKKVVVQAIPYEQFVHDINDDVTLSKKWQVKGYKRFYHLPKKLKLDVEKTTESEQED